MSVPDKAMKLKDGKILYDDLRHRLNNLKYAIYNPDALRNCVNFIDYDGSIVYSYTASEAMALTELPMNPVHVGLVSQGWNWTLAAIKNQLTKVGGTVWVGQMYITASGATEIDMVFNDPDYLSPYFTFTLSANGAVSIDWGDGSEPDVITNDSGEESKISQLHEYPVIGSYTMKITVTNGSVTLVNADDNKEYTFRVEEFGQSSRIYNNCARNIRIGTDVNIGGFAFTYLYNVRTITIPNGITSFGQQAFNKCFNLVSLTIPTTVSASETGDFCFESCRSLMTVSVPYTFTIFPSGFLSAAMSLESITIPYGVTSLGGSVDDGGDVFLDCYSLVDVTIPETVECFGGWDAFMDCYSLKSIVIPDNVETLGSYAFEYCYALKNINIPNTVTAIQEQAFNGCSSLESLTIPPSVTSIEKKAFASCDRLDVTIPDTVTSIAAGAFWATGIRKADIPNGITKIEDNTFTGCYYLHHVTIPDTVTEIGISALSSCYSLTEIVIPVNVVKIDKGAFLVSPNLKDIHLRPTTPPTLVNANAFSNIKTDAKIYVPYSADHSILNAYKAATNWSTYASKMEEEPQ